MKKDITLIVLAGGEGKRLWPLTTNKALFPFFGLPLFTHTIADARVAKMIIVTNPVNDEIIRSYKFPIPTSTVIQKEPKGMADGLLSCREAIAHSPIVVMSVDDAIDSELLSHVISTDTFGAIPGLKRSGPFGYIKFKGDRPIGIVEKPKEGDEPSPYINIVCHYISDGSELISEIEKINSSADDVYEKALTNLMARHEFAFVPYEGVFAPLKYPWQVLSVMNALFDGLEYHKGKNVTIKKNVIIEGAVYIEDNVKIYENTKIVGPCYIGKNTIIGNNSIIRESHIGADSVIGFNCDVTRSYIGDNCWLHMNYVGDSVLEKNISMGGGAKLANLRLDDGEIATLVQDKKISTGRNKLGAMIGAGARVGVNASIMPGVKIGANSFVGSGIVLSADLPEDSFCLLDSKMVIKKNTRPAPAKREDFRKHI